MTTRAEIHAWLLSARASGATHVIIVCDTFDHEDYPVEVMPDQNVRVIEAHMRDLSMQRVMEVYCLADDLEEQLDEYRCFRYEPKGKK